jgi:hypothetical protein
LDFGGAIRKTADPPPSPPPPVHDTHARTEHHTTATPPPPLPLPAAQLLPPPAPLRLLPPLRVFKNQTPAETAKTPHPPSERGRRSSGCRLRFPSPSLSPPAAGSVSGAEGGRHLCSAPLHPPPAAPLPSSGHNPPRSPTPFQFTSPADLLLAKQTLFLTPRPRPPPGESSPLFVQASFLPPLRFAALLVLCCYLYSPVLEDGAGVKIPSRRALVGGCGVGGGW